MNYLINNAVQNSFSCSSATYSASVNFSSCSTQPTVRWNRQNGSSFAFVGSGLTLTDTPNFDDVTYRLDLVGPGGVVMHSITRTFPGKRPKTLSGPSTMTPSQVSTFSLNAPGTTVNWSVYSACSNIQFSTNSYADVKNNNCPPNLYITVNASGSWQCGTFGVSKGVTVTQFMAPPTNQDGDDQKSEVVADKDELELEERSDAAAESLPKPFDVVFYPVPVKNGQLNGNVLGKFESGLLRILDLTGREVMSAGVLGNNFQVDLPNVQAGIYIAQVSTENGVVTQKILLED